MSAPGLQALQQTPVAVTIWVDGLDEVHTYMGGMYAWGGVWAWAWA